MLSTPVVLIAFNRPASGAPYPRRDPGGAAPERVFLVCRRAARRPTRRRCAVRRDARGVRRDRLAVPGRAQVLRPSTSASRATSELGLDWVFAQVARGARLRGRLHARPDVLPVRRGAARPLPSTTTGCGRSPATATASRTRLYKGDSYAFSTWASVWGWATWADRWQRHRAVFPRDHVRRSAADAGDAPVRTVPRYPRPARWSPGPAGGTSPRPPRRPTSITHGWDKHWWMTIMTEGGSASRRPATWWSTAGSGRTRPTATRRAARTTRREPMQFPLRHPDPVAHRRRRRARAGAPSQPGRRPGRPVRSQGGQVA